MRALERERNERARITVLGSSPFLPCYVWEALHVTYTHAHIPANVFALREREREIEVPQVTRAHHFTLVEFTTLLRRHALQG